MTIVSTGFVGLGAPEGPTDGLVDGPADPVGEGLIDGAGVSSGGPESIDGTADGGAVGTAPRLPEVEHAVVATTRHVNARIGRMDRSRLGFIGWAPDADDVLSLDQLGRHRIAGA